MALIGAFLGLRLGELVGLRRAAIDLDAPTMRVVAAQAGLGDGTIVDKQPKLLAGRRILAVPAPLVPELRGVAELVASSPPSCL